MYKNCFTNIYLTIIITLCFYFALGMLLDTNEGFGDDIPNVSFPFKNLFDDKGSKLNIILLSAPFRGADHDKQFESYKEKKLEFCGISSYREFPTKIVNKFEDTYHEMQKHNYLKMVKAWLHCFRKPEDYIVSPRYLDNEPPIHLPNILMTEADLKDPSAYKYEPDIEKEYDFIYVCLNDNSNCTDGWQATARNWDLAKKCLVVLCRDFNLRGLLVGRENCEITDFCEELITIKNLLPYHEFQNELKKSRLLLAPNIEDASPRVITEAMLYNIPVLVNYNILGGFHNVIPDVTGEFFTDENNIVEALNKVLKNYDKYTPRDWYINNRGRENSGKILAKFLIDTFPNINKKEMKYAYIS